MKRRSFLCRSLTTGLGLTILPSRIRAEPSKNDTLQLAQIGCGRMGRGDMGNALTRGLKSDLNARIVACCDVDANRAAAAAGHVQKFYQAKGENNPAIPTFGDHRELLQRDDIDGFIISTPENWHALIGIDAANASKHLYVQKPLTYSIPEGQALVKAVRSKGVILQTGSQQRSSIYFRQVCSIVRNQWLGKLQRIEVEVPTDKGRADGKPAAAPKGLDYERWLGPCPEIPYIESRVHPAVDLGRPGWLQVERHCLGMITGWGSHMYDIAQWAMGTDHSGPVEISAKGEFPNRGLFDVHVGYKGRAVYANGVVMTSGNGNPGVKFIMENGWAYCARGKMDCSDKSLLRRQPTAEETTLHLSANHMDDFIAAIRSGADPICPVEVGHRSNTICVLHHLSMKLDGRQLKWDPVKEMIIGDDDANARLKVPMRKPYTL